MADVHTELNIQRTTCRNMNPDRIRVLLPENTGRENRQSTTLHLGGATFHTTELDLEEREEIEWVRRGDNQKGPNH